MYMQFIDIPAKQIFEEINLCSSPILLTGPDGQSVDIRNNTFLQDLLVSSNPDGMIAHLVIRTSTPEDTQRMIRYMLGGSRDSQRRQGRYA